MIHWLYEDPGEPPLHARMLRAAELLLGGIAVQPEAEYAGPAPVLLAPDVPENRPARRAPRARPQHEETPMTAIDLPSPPSYARRRRRARPQWRRANRALRALLREPERTEQAFEVIAALDPDLMERGLALMLSHPVGRRLFVERPCLLERLSDRDALAHLPDGSLGRSYLAHIERYGLDPGKLAELGRSFPEIRAEDEGTRWFADRSELSHDLHHVLTGYGADGLGETALLWFSHGLAGGRGNALLMIGAALRSSRYTGRGFALYLWRAWRRGRRAGCLAAMPFEELLAAPLAEVRRVAQIEAPEVVHPGGVRAEQVPATR